MSTGSTAPRGVGRRMNSNQKVDRGLRQASAGQPQKPTVGRYDAYTFALRVAYLSHLLQPKARRIQHAPTPQRPPLQRHSTSVVDLVKDFSRVRDSKTTRFPRGFVPELRKRLEGVMVGTERMQEYSEPTVKRSMNIYLNELLNDDFRKNVEKDRRVEDLLLMFYSRTARELGKGKTPGDDSWKLMADRHVALFARLISATLKANGWATDRPELMSRLESLEKNLLTHAQDLNQSSQNGSSTGTSTEVEIPRSEHVKDMPLVTTVATIFRKALSSVQEDLDEQKELWTPKAALQDLKMYQTNLNVNSKKTLRSADFDTDEAFEAWKKAEGPDLSQMMLAIVQSNMELAKSTPGVLPQVKANASIPSSPIDYTDQMRKLSESSLNSSYVIDQPVDMSALNLNGDDHSHSHVGDESDPYMFIPPEPRAYYRAILKEALSYDIRDESLEIINGDPNPVKLLSKKSSDLLNEIGTRWRIPFVSRLLLFLDVVKELYIDRAVNLDTLDAAFNFFKEPTVDKKKFDLTILGDRTKWTLADYVLNQHILNSLHDTLLRDFFEEFLNCYDTKGPAIGPILTVLETHIESDDLFSKSSEEAARLSKQLDDALRDKAMSVYTEIFDKQIRQNQDQLEFYHIIQLGKSVLKLCERIQKRYRKTPEIMGVEPFTILVETVLPLCTEDIGSSIETVMQQAESKQEEIPIQDGFDLYKELVEIRRVHSDALSSVQFPFNLEGLLSNFVWKLIASTEQNMLPWVEGAVKQDNFALRIEHPNQIPTEDERHSHSVIDIFRSFNQSVNGIIQLNWDDELQYAKFMTALSKSIGTGLIRYCEMVEQLFIKEMDRLTPEQEMEMRQTKQEKWMRMAKDAISTKEKMHPFQFYPESFIKLNNIEYAMQQLDKLQSNINVDACADVIKRKEPAPPPRQRKQEKYVFTVKIVEAEDLKPMDHSGLSDPYVVLGDEYQKRLAKTRIVYGNLNPRWDETVDISTVGPVTLTATIWDWDIMGDHDCEGRTTLKLDPSAFKDFMPREYWLDLDTQGRLLVRVSMEGEKDEIQFHFGKTFRALKRTERDMTRKITDKLSAYIHHCLSQRTLRNLTRQGITMSSVSKYLNFQNTRAPATPLSPTDVEVDSSIQPLTNYFDENFAIMQQTLTKTAMLSVMGRVWKEVLSTIESLLVPPLSDKPSSQRQLSQQELDIVFKWLHMLLSFFHADGDGVPMEVLRSAKFHELNELNFFYHESPENLIRTSEARAAAINQRQREIGASANRLSAPAAMSPGGLGYGTAGGLMGLPSTRRNKSVMLSRNLGTMKKAKEEKRKEARAEPSDDMLLRILRMRPEPIAAQYLRDREKQKQKQATNAAAEAIVRQSLLAEARKSGRR